MKKLKKLNTTQKAAIGVGIATAAFLGYRFFKNRAVQSQVDPGLTHQIPEPEEDTTVVEPTTPEVQATAPELIQPEQKTLAEIIDEIPEYIPRYQRQTYINRQLELQRQLQ